MKKQIKKIFEYLIRPRGTVTIRFCQICRGEVLNGKHIVITGGGGGIGYAMAKRFISEGAIVLISGRNETKLLKAVQELGPNCKHLVNDVTDVKNTELFLESCSQILGKIDCLVCNAGISLHEGNIENVTIEGYDKQMDVNLKANYFLTQAFVRKHVDGCQQDLLFISSLTGNQIYDLPYGMAKAGLNSMVQKINRKYYKSGLRVNAIAPGMIPTEITKTYIDTSDGNLFCPEECGRYFLPEEIAEVALFLLSEASRIIAGEVISCDGGMTQKAIWK